MVYIRPRFFAQLWELCLISEESERESYLPVEALNLDSLAILDGTCEGYFTGLQYSWSWINLQDVLHHLLTVWMPSVLESV